MSGPTPSFSTNPITNPIEATTRRLDGATQPPPGASDPPPQPVQQHGAKRLPTPQGLRSRLALLAAALYMPLILLGYALYLYGPTNCVAGPFCSLVAAPALLQGLLLALGFILLYFIGVRPLAALLDDREPARSDTARLLRRATRYETVRPLLALFAGLIALLTLVGLFAHALPPLAFLLGACVVALLLWLALSSEP